MSCLTGGWFCRLIAAFPYPPATEAKLQAFRSRTINMYYEEAISTMYSIEKAQLEENIMCMYTSNKSVYHKPQL